MWWYENFDCVCVLRMIQILYQQLRLRLRTENLKTRVLRLRLRTEELHYF